MIGELTSLRPSTLLTGAGFSAAWGAPTADRVWSKLISDPAVQSCERVRTALLETGGFRFEEVLDRAQSGEFGPDGLEQLLAAVNRVYDEIEWTLRAAAGTLSRRNLGEFLKQFLA